jgi:hypothetical protein
LFDLRVGEDMRKHKGSLLVVGGLIVLLAGCNGGASTVAPSESASPTDSASSTADSSTDSGTDSGSTPATVVVPTTVNQAPVTVTQAPVTTTETRGSGHNGNRGGNTDGNHGNGSGNGGGNGSANGGGNGHGNGNNGGLRPLNPTERQTYQRCQHEANAAGCNEYTPDALRKRGIDPNS